MKKKEIATVIYLGRRSIQGLTGCRERKEKKAKMPKTENVKGFRGEICVSILDMLSLKCCGNSR